MTRKTLSWSLLILVNALIWGVLSFYKPSAAAPPPPSSRLPFGNAVEQRERMIRELQTIQLLLKEQNSLLRTIGDSKDEKKRP